MAHQTCHRFLLPIMAKSAAWSFFIAFHSLSALSHTVRANSDKPLATPSSASRPDVCAFEPGAKVSDACASYAELDALNARVHPSVSELVHEADFFSYYRLNLYNKVCPFWSDENGVCGNIACAVTTVEDEDEMPLTWRAEELSRLQGPKAHHPGKVEQRNRPRKPLQGELGANVDESCVVEYDDECDERDYCVPEDESASAKGDYVSLIENPERYTGYAGEGARQVWEAIYRENCFSRPAQNGRSSFTQAGNPFGALSGPKAQAAMEFRNVMVEHVRHQAVQTGSSDDQLELEDDCVEKRLFYRIISGMHASISTHLCYDYLNQTTGLWGPNLECYKTRLHKHPERISNLYFNYAVVTRAVAKLKDYMQEYTFCTGDPEEDSRTKTMITNLAKELPSGNEAFDEHVMFKDSPSSIASNGVSLKEDFRNRFRNVSRIMDCVGCDKCRLWGKLQTAGYGTALKVLFEFGHGDDNSAPTLRRTELIALINTLDKVSQALRILGEFRVMMEEEQQAGKVKGTKKSLSSSQPIKYAANYEDDEDLGAILTDDAPPKTIIEIFWEEWHNVWTTYVYVLKQWASIPGKMYAPLKV